MLPILKVLFRGPSSSSIVIVIQGSDVGIGCNGICHRQKVSRGGTQPFYSKDNPDHKYCSTCDVKLNSPSNFCFCCGFRLRTKPRNGKLFKQNNEVYPEPVMIELRN